MYKLSRNRYSIQTKALTDTRANGIAFINTLYIVDNANFLNLKAERLPNLITVRGYNRKAQNSITHFLWLYITIDRQRQYNIPLLILDLGLYDCILGCKWLEYFGILVDAKN